MATLYATYGWAAGAAKYDVEFWNYLTNTTSVVASGQKPNQISYGASDEFPGLLLVYPVSTINRRSKPYTFPVNSVPVLATLRWGLRAALNDTETEDGVDYKYPESPKWPDSELDNYIREAISFYSTYLPEDRVIKTRSDFVEPRMFANVKSVLTVTYYDVEKKEWLQLPKSSRRGYHGRNREWDFTNGNLILYGTFREPVDLQVGVTAPYATPLNDYNPILVPTNDWDILSLYAQGRAYVRLAGQSAQLDRWKEEGRRNDNPVTPIARLLLDRAEERLQDRLGPRAIHRVRG